MRERNIHDPIRRPWEQPKESHIPEKIIFVLIDQHFHLFHLPLDKISFDQIGSEHSRPQKARIGPYSIHQHTIDEASGDSEQTSSQKIEHECSWNAPRL